jgi:hypothetical protein
LRHNSGLFFRLHFKFPLPFLKVCKTFRQRLILFAQLFGLILDVRKLVGMAPVATVQIIACENSRFGKFFLMNFPAKAR